ncbi:LAFE_0G03356g1_1 [Lachancea fermentati]|uniref:LAFE_0G03356g1_1 n=1 Tax=Lachancea fermentati TaxID=4955 RepID=A0A1G4MGS9_LACFM|nr:LAFE_0G03356g1_1 [Lachancea fermentati]
MSNHTKILLSSEGEASLPKYEGHFVPCKSRYTGSTLEFKDNFKEDTEDTSTSSSDNVSTYVRGRKLVGKPLNFLESCSMILVEESTDAEDQTTMKKVADVSKLINYEREGNESRLEEEMAKFQEFLNLNDIIHS